MTAFSAQTIEEISEAIIDYRGKTPPKSDSGIRLITAKVIKDGFINDDYPEYIAEITYDEWMRRGFPKQWDILITTEAPLGELAQLRTPDKVALAQRVILLRGNPDIVSQQYFFHVLKTREIQAQLHARSTGTTVAGIKQSELRQVRIPIPPLDLQHIVGVVLSAYDDLIENSQRRIRILEDMAQSIYREWFVNFRFPGHENVPMVDSPLGKIPEGWRYLRLGEVAGVNSSTIRKGQAPEVINYINIASVSTGKVDDIETLSFSDAPGRARRIVKDCDLIWSTVRPNLKAYALILNPPPSLIASTGFAVISAREVPYSYLYNALTTEEFVGYLVNHARGAAYPAVNTEDFDNAPILVPTTEIVESFHDLTSNMFQLRQTLLDKNKLLRQTRDLLLPKLISGEIDISRLENSVAEEVA